MKRLVILAAAALFLCGTANAQEALWGSGFAGCWQEIVHLLMFLLFPPLFMRRLQDAYVNQDYERD